MPEAVIVATARSPIGRAFKGSLKDLRPDDLTATVVRAALDKVPQLDPAEIDDLLLGCGLPGGEQGFNMARVVAVLLGYDSVPGTTVTRYCSSSLQTTRMALHAIKAGEGDVFVSAGVEMVSRYAKGSSDSLPDTMNPAFNEAMRSQPNQQAGDESPWVDPRDAGQLPDVYIAMGQTAENVAQLKGISRAEQDEFGVRSQNLAEKAIADGFWEREITPITLPGRHRRDQGRRPARRHRPSRASRQPQARLPPERHRDRRQLLPAQRRRRRGGHHERHQGPRARHHPARPDRQHRRQRPVAGDHGPRPDRGVEAGAEARRHEHR